MGMDLTTYVGPMIRVDRTQDFDAHEFCYKTCDESLYVPNEPVKPFKHWYLLPNKSGLTSHSFSVSEHNSDQEPLINPDIEGICEEFSKNTESFRALIPLHHDVVWGVISYWS